MPLYLQENKKFIILNNLGDTTDIKSNEERPKILRYGHLNDYSGLSGFSKVEHENVWIIQESSSMKANNFSLVENVVYQAPFFKTKNGGEVGLSHIFYVKLGTSSDLVHLKKLAIEHNVNILGSNKFMPLWYTLACSKKSNGNALAMANLFYETGFFLASEPDLMVDNLVTCTNDPHFANQWGADNIGQNGGLSGIDINLCQARPISSGSEDIVVAVLDHGVELNHPDLSNMSPLSFDSHTGTSPSFVRGNHGTACAGIIGGADNNGIGITGIAPDCPLMSISNSLSGVNNSPNLANGLNLAWQNGASVISNSWDTILLQVH